MAFLGAARKAFHLFFRSPLPRVRRATRNDKSARTMLLVPGYNEPQKDMGRLIEGRDRIPGFRANGYDCLLFPRQHDNLHDRIDRFADFIARLKKRDPGRFPVVNVGYSLGGLVVRGYLRAFPERADDISHTITIGTPHWGIATDVLPRLTWALRVPDRAMEDMDLRSLFMKWLNGTGGRWERRPKSRWRFWKLDSEPVIAPPGHKLLSIIGTVPRFGDDNDGIVWNDSSTLDGRIPAFAICDEMANHLNLVGLFSFAAMLVKGLRADDTVWPHVLDAAAKFGRDEISGRAGIGAAPLD